MICLSTADESLSRHLSWNQSPPPLAAAHTTCQDLNGIANLREHVDSAQDGGGASHGALSSACGQGKLDGNHGSPRRTAGGDHGTGRRSCDAGLSLCRKTATGGDGRICCRCRGADPLPVSPTWSKAAQSAGWWMAWLLSVLLTSVMLSSWDLGLGPRFAPRSVPRSARSTTSNEMLDVSPVKKRNTCATGGVQDQYNTPLHVGALFIILTVSTLACAFPLLAVRFPGLRIPARFFFGVRHFGTGVLIATAFVHLIPTAFISLGDPCLDSFWTDDYPAMPGAISLAAIFFVVVVEMVFHPSRHIHPIELTAPSPERGCMGNHHHHHHPGMQPVRDMGPIAERSASISHGLTALNSQDDDHRMDTIRRAGHEASVPEPRKQDCEEAATETAATETPAALPSPQLTTEQQHRRELLQCVLLELGILFHSVFIGMAISVSIGSEFLVLLIAIAFHQTFEGLALGSRIASVRWPHGQLQPWFMALAYGCTTPIGQALGLATHTLYRPDSAVGLIVVGVMNAISAGLLVFASLVELLSEDLLSDQSWRFLRGRERVYACLLVFFGAFFMSLVGAWA